jgi:putative FmdB family regulatory protein
MPTYMYRCTDCEHIFETQQRMTDDPLTDCPRCGGKIRRVVNSVGVVFKGKGFYVTDNRGSKAQAPNAAGKKEAGAETSSESSAASSAASSESSASGSSESKPVKQKSSETS